MNQCKHIAELLPWLLNGTLAADERADVRRHLAECAHCQQELDETALAFVVHGQHVSAEALADFAFDRQPENTDIALLEQHLAACGECAEQVALARASRHWAETQDARPHVEPVAEKTFWQSLRLWQYGALAACLIGSIAIGGWLMAWRQAQNQQTQLSAAQRESDERLRQLQTEREQLRQSGAQTDAQLEASRREIAQLQARVSELAAPQINALTLDVYPQGFLRRSDKTALNELTIPRGVTTVSLILNSQSAAAAQSMEIANAGGATVWRASRLKSHASNAYTLSLPANFLPPGNYTINLYAVSQGRRVKVESYPIVVRK